MKIPKMILILASLILLLNCSFHNPFLETSLNALFEDEMVFVPGGTFLQTSSNSDGSVEESFTHTISSFYIGKFEVTYELWHEVYIWALDNGYSFGFQGKEGGNQPATYENVGGAPTSRREEPATGINWRDAIVWCNALSQKEGRTPAYYTDSAFTLPLKTSTGVDSYDIDPGEQDNPYVLWSSNGYRLPTEGEWMYAAAYVDGTAWTPHNYAAGASADFNDQAATTQVAWYAPNSDQGSGPQTRVVGTLKANPLGIYDMSGNAREILWDWEGDYPSGPETNYRGVDSGTRREAHGGSYFLNHPPFFFQVGNRVSVFPWNNYYSQGLRLARSK